MICEAVEAYLATLPERAAEPVSEELSEPWFAQYDEAAHAMYETRTPTRLARFGSWLVRRSR